MPVSKIGILKCMYLWLGGFHHSSLQRIPSDFPLWPKVKNTIYQVLMDKIYTSAIYFGGVAAMWSIFIVTFFPFLCSYEEFYEDVSIEKASYYLDASRKKKNKWIAKIGNQS